MISFMVGVFVGELVTVIILGFLSAASDPDPEPPKRKSDADPDSDPWRWYLEDDGK